MTNTFDRFHSAFGSGDDFRGMDHDPPPKGGSDELDRLAARIDAMEAADRATERATRAGRTN